MTDWERRKTLRPGRGPSLDVDSRQDELDMKETSSRGRASVLDAKVLG